MKNINILVLFFVLFTTNLFAQNDLILHLTFDGNANDTSGNNNNGTVHKAVLTADRNGNPNGAYDFNGIDSFIEIPPSASLNEIYTSEEVTIAAWINIRNWYQGWNVFPIIEQYDPVNDFGSLIFEANWASGGILFEAGYNNPYAGANYTWDFNVWHHVAVTYKKSDGMLKFYVDGNLISSQTYSQGFSSDLINSFAIGRSLSGPDEYSDGKIDEISIYRRALSSTEITEMLATSSNTVQKLNIYPNPVNDFVNIDTVQKIKSVILVDSSGKLIRNFVHPSSKISLIEIPKGIYILKVNFENGTAQTKKIAKE